MAALWSSSQFLFYLVVSLLIFGSFVCFEFKVNVVVKDIYDETVVSLNIDWGWIHILSITRPLVKKLVVIQMNEILQFHGFFLHFPFFSLLESGGVKCISPKFYLYESEAGNVTSNGDGLANGCYLWRWNWHYSSFQVGRDHCGLRLATCSRRAGKIFCGEHVRGRWYFCMLSICSLVGRSEKVEVWRGFSFPCWLQVNALFLVSLYFFINHFKVTMLLVSFWWLLKLLLGLILSST